MRRAGKRILTPARLALRRRRVYRWAMFTVAALYHFTRIDDPVALRGPLFAFCEARGIRGTLLIAPEGINGTLAGEGRAIEELIAHLRGLPGCADLDWKESHASEPPFRRLKVRLKKEIVTMGVPGIDPNAAKGRYVAPADWNALISAPDVVVIDTRNDYEVAIGRFEGAVDPGTESFRDFPAWWDRNHNRMQGKRIAMYCTGGIRCEKSTAYLRSKGVEDVYHLQGGILKYLEEVPQEQSLWHGGCFVFDGRVSVGHGLEEGPHLLCFGCRRPLEPSDTDKAGYERGVSCHQCHEETTEADKARFRERQRQIDLARARA
jgi:UPF0176 protein